MAAPAPAGWPGFLAARPWLILPLVAFAAAVIAVATPLAWIGQPFPGFFTWPFDIVAWGGRPAWGGIQADLHADDRILAVDGRPPAARGEHLARVQAAAPGTAITYLLEKDAATAAKPRVTVTIPSQVFGWGDFFAAMGPLLLLGAFYIGVGAVAYAIRPRAPAATALLAWSTLLGFYFVTLGDSQGGQRLIDLGFPAATLLVAGFWHIALVFPRPFAWYSGQRWLVAAPYALAGAAGLVLAVAYDQAWRLHYGEGAPAWLIPAQRVQLLAQSLALVGFIAAILWKVRGADDPLARAQSTAVLLGLTGGFLPYIVVFIVPYVFGIPNPLWHYSQQALLLTALFPAAVAVAIVRYNLFDLNSLIKRTLTYALSTGVALAGYFLLSWALGVALEESGLDALSQAGATAVIALSFATIHDRIRRVLDRWFDRSAFDLGRVVSAFSARTSDSLDVEALTASFMATLDATLKPRYTVLSLAGPDGASALRAHDGLEPAAATEVLARGGGEGEMVVPLRTGTRELGKLVLGPKRSDQTYSAEDQTLVESLGQALALSANNAMLVARLADQARLERELEIATEVQAGLLPKDPPRPPDLELALMCEPALEVGGDFYDVVRIDATRWGVIIGDVAGKGVPAALMMALSLAFFRAIAPGQTSPAATLGALNALIHGNRPSKKIFVTAVYMVYDAETGAVAIANAGQPRPLLDGVPLEIKGLPLGAMSKTAYRELATALAPGATLVAYSDGLEDLEDRQGRQFGPTRVEAFFRGIGGSAVAAVESRLLADLRAFAADAPPADDLTVAILRRKSGGTRELTLAEAERSVAEAVIDDPLGRIDAVR